MPHVSIQAVVSRTLATRDARGLFDFRSSPRYRRWVQKISVLCNVVANQAATWLSGSLHCQHSCSVFKPTPAEYQQTVWNFMWLPGTTPVAMPVRQPDYPTALEAGEHMYSTSCLTTYPTRTCGYSHGSCNFPGHIPKRSPPRLH